MSQATMLAVFRLSSQKEIRTVKERFSVMAEVPNETFMNLRPGECMIAALQSTSPTSVFRVCVRPTVTHAGGETLRTTA